MGINIEFFKYNNELYIIDRRIKVKYLKEDKIEELRELLECDLVLKSNNTKDSHFLFLRKIEDAQIVS